MNCTATGPARARIRYRSWNEPVARNQRPFRTGTHVHRGQGILAQPVGHDPSGSGPSFWGLSGKLRHALGQTCGPGTPGTGWQVAGAGALGRSGKSHRGGGTRVHQSDDSGLGPAARVAASLAGCGTPGSRTSRRNQENHHRLLVTQCGKADARRAYPIDGDWRQFESRAAIPGTSGDHG